jgi:hypothetical protein
MAVTAADHASGQPRIRTALSAMAVQYVKPDSARMGCNGPRSFEIAQTRFAAHGHAFEAERKFGFNGSKAPVCQRIKRIGIRKDTNFVSLIRLLPCQIQYMPEQAANWSAHAMQNTKALGHGTVGG